MSSRAPLRSQSVGSIPREKKHTTSRVESASGASLDVRCACQYFQCDSLLPERINPVGSRPESNIGFVSDVPPFDSQTGHEFFAERPGMQYDQLSTKSCMVGHGHHPDADRISSKSFGMGVREPSTELTNKIVGLENKSGLEQASQKGLVVRSISDATDPDIMPPPWKQRAVSIDRLSNRSYGVRDPDTISTRSVGLRRISRTPSKTDLFVADIIIPTVSKPASRRGSKIDIPQFNFIAPTPTREMKAPFSVYEEFRKNKPMVEDDVEVKKKNKENVPSNAESCAPKDKGFNNTFPPDPGQGSFSVSNQTAASNIQPLMQSNRGESGTERQDQRQTSFTDTQKLKRQHAADFEKLPDEFKQTPMSSLDMEVDEILSKVEDQPKQESSFSMKSFFKSSKPAEPEQPVDGYQKEDSFSIKSFFKSNKSTEPIEDPKEEETSQLKSALKQNKQIELAELEQITDMSFPLRPVELFVGGEENIPERTKPLIIETAMKPLTPSAPTETFSLKVDELDQYTIKPKVIAPLPVKPAQKLKVSSIDLSRASPPIDDRRSRQTTPLSPNIAPIPVVDPTLSKSKLFKRSDILRSSQPDLSAQRNLDNMRSRDRSVTPLRQQNLVSVSIDIPEPPVSEEKISEEFVAKNSEFQTEDADTSVMSIEQKQSINMASKPGGKPPVVRSTSKDRIMQSKLLRKKDYFNRTQSQDRTPRASSIGASSGDLRSGSVPKTVSFDFGDHHSRRAGHESQKTNLTMDKRDWIERSYFKRDHEYEAIGEPVETQTQPKRQEKEPSPITIPTVEVSEPMEVDEEKPSSAAPIEPAQLQESETSPEQINAQELQNDIEECYFSSATTTPRTESRTDCEIHTSQVDSSALEELPLKHENRKKGFMASAQDKSRKVQANLRSQAGKIRTKLRGMKKPASGSPKTKERKRFKAPEFSKVKLPEMKRPEMPKFKTPDMSKFKAPDFKKIEFKRPEFTKFNKPDMSKFKMPERFSSLKLTRSRSLKEPPPSLETTSGTSPESAATPVKKKFEFSFGTYPRALRKKKDKIANQVVARADDVPSTETPPSLESATIPRGPRDKGPVGSRWVDKFSDVSYGDSESGKYQRYGSEVESLERGERDSSVERRMKEDLSQSTPEEAEIANLETVEQKQFAEYDEENRAIHEISKNRESEFKKRRPMVHQISDLSEESKDVGWTERDILRNKIFRKTEAEAEPENYPSEEGLTGSITNTNQETLSTGSSGPLRQKGVLEEIDDDQFFLRKRGISQDNIEIRQYISSAIREGFDMPVNALAQLGDSQGIYPEMDSTGQISYGYDVPPPKPRRAKYKYDENIDSAEISQEFDIERKENYDDDISLPQTGSDYFKNLPPGRPLRKSKKQYSEDSQDVPDSDLPYFDDEDRLFYKKEENNNLDIPEITRTFHPTEDFEDEEKTETPPKAPKRRKKQLRESMENDSFVNGFGGRSISNSFLQNDIQVEELVVYRTEHEYVIPLAQAENFSTPTPPTRSRSRSRVTEDDRTSREADSLVLDMQQEDERFFVEMKENDGYAIVRKDPPPRPPPPVRRKRSPNLLDEKFATMPHLKSEAPPERPKRNYSTIGPSRPPRRKSSTSMGESPLNGKITYVTEYEELDVEDTERPESPRNLKSGDVINKMKYRPLPPPPRPPREHKKYKGGDDKFDKDEGAEKIVSDIQQNGNYEIEKSVEKCIEVEVSTQTDPLPDDFVCEEFEITADMKVIEPRRSKTLEDILKEEQEAEMERARQLVEEENFTRSIQKFRDAGQRSYSERSRGSTAERSRTQSRPTTPSAIVIEKRVPTPIPNKVNETMLTASLIVQPIDDFDMEDELAKEFRSEEKLEEQIEKSDVSSQKQEEEERLTIDYSSDQRSMTSEQRVSDQEIRESPVQERSYQKDQAFDEPVLPSEQDEDQRLESESEEPPPQPPPRKRSSVPTVEAAPIVPSEQPESALSVVSEQPPNETTPSNRLAVADLEVERLSVHALQAGRIMVSQLQGDQISADELECKSGNLVVRNMEFPPGFIEEIIERVRSTERDHSQAQTQTTDTGDVRSTAATQEEAPARPPPPQQPVFPSEYMQYSMPPPSFFELRNPTDEEHPQNLQAHRRRRHHRRRDSSSDEEHYREHRRSRQGTISPEPTIGQLGGQLLRLCGSSVLRTMNQIVNYLQTTQKEGNERNISTAIVLLVLMAFGFLMLGLSGKNIHHHHWDFFNPPGNEGRGQ